MHPNPEDSSQRWLLTVAYDGEPHDGWQSQPSGNTIQDHLERALAEVKGMPPGTRVHASGRTDAGVHALGQMAHFDAPRMLSLDGEAWPRAVNTRLPPSIRVLKGQPVSSAFHARFSAREKTYLYRVDLGKILHPLRAGRVAHFPGKIDLEALQEAAALLRGRHDFSAFGASRGKKAPAPRSTVRQLRELGVAFDAAEEAKPLWTRRQGPELVMRFTADGFLFRMVRMLAGTMIRFAQGKLSRAELERLLSAGPGVKTSACAPAAGLYLLEVRYERDQEVEGATRIQKNEAR